MIGGGGGDLGCRGHFWGTYRSIKRRPVCAGLPGMYRSPGPSQCSGDWTRQASSWGPVPQPPQARSSCSPVVGAWLALPWLFAAISLGRWGLLAVHQVSN